MDGHEQQRRSASGEPDPRVGVVGLGMIGAMVATNLVRSGHVPTVFDVRPDAADGLEGVPAVVATAGEVARASDVVLVAVVNAEQARDVLTGDDGLLTVGRDGLVVVLLSTVPVAAVKELAELCARHGATLVDAGVTQAGDNKLVVMVGGPDDVVARTLPVLETFSKDVVHCGGLGAGMVTKLARNMVVYSCWAVAREAAELADAGGVPLERLLRTIRSAVAAGQTPAQGIPTPTSMMEMQLADGPLPAERVAAIDGLAQKDLAAAQELAGEMGVETPIVDVVRAKMPAVLTGELFDPLPEDRWERGIEMMNRVYGDGPGAQVQDRPDVSALPDIVEHLFGDIWSRGHLTTRDRRLLTLGATAMLGRRDLLEVQLRGAMTNGELTTAQLREIPLFLTYYTSVQNSGAILTLVEQLIAERDAEAASGSRGPAPAAR